MEKKCDIKEVQQVEKRLSKLELEEKLQEHSTQLNNKICQLEEGWQQKIQECGKTFEEKILQVDDRCIKQISEIQQDKTAWQAEISRKAEEDNDVERRKRNIIIYKVPELKSDKYEERRESDMVFIADLLDSVFQIKLQQGDIEKMFRLGRKSVESQSPRPLLLAFKEQHVKDSLMASVRNLGRADTRFKGISISHDIPPKDREEIKKLIEDAKKEHASKGEDLENYRFLVVGQGQKRTVIKVKKQH